MGKLITAWDSRTGKRRQVPEHWFDHEDLSANLTRTDPKIPQVAPAGVNQAPGPDAPDFATPDEIAAAAAESGDLKGAALKAALKDAGLPQTGTADEQRAALVTHQERAALLAEIDQLNTVSVTANGHPAIEVTPGDTNEDLRGLIALAGDEPPTDSPSGDSTTTNNTPPAGDE